MLRAAVAGLGCLFLPLATFIAIVGWIEYSITDKRASALYGLAALVLFALGFLLLWRVNAAIYRRRRRG